MASGYCIGWCTNGGKNLKKDDDEKMDLFAGLDLVMSDSLTLD